MKRADKLDISTLTLLKLWFQTLFYHSSLDLGYFLETLVTPCFWLVDHTTGLIGKIFVILVVFLVSSIGTIAHLIGIPVYASSSPIYLYGFLVPLGYWILINIGFNFTLACRTDPGRPVDLKQLSKRTESNTICKKCIQPKPPRTHHCSICNTCYLKMDHHCPWINNCVGHFNHRYFYLTMVYITVGCLYMMIFGLDIAYRQLYLDEDVLPFEIEIINTSNAQSSFPVPPVNPDSDTQDNQGTKSLQEYIDENAWLQFALRIFGFGKVSKSRDNIDNYGEYTRLLFGIVVNRQFYTGMIYMAALLCVGACLALGGLSIWHAQLIGRGETSIEYHINKAGRKKLGDKYENPYDCGKLRNWVIFLGLDQPGKSFWKHILFPSAHCPTGNGYEWSYLPSGHHDIRDNYYKEC